MSVSLRPYVPADARRCADIFRASIEELAADDYSADQREAWASAADDEDAFAARLAGALTLIAVIDGAAAGFASLKGGDVIDMLYVAPEFARRGGGSTLIDALTEARRRARGKAPHGGRQRGGEAAVRTPRLSGPETQSRARRRRMVRQHHHDEIAWRGTRAAKPGTEREPYVPRTALSLRHDAARRRADDRCRLLARRQAQHRRHARPARDRLRRGRLSRERIRSTPNSFRRSRRSARGSAPSA